MSVRSTLSPYSIPMRQTKRSSELLPPKSSLLDSRKSFPPSVLQAGVLSCLAGGRFRTGMGERMKREGRSTNRPIKTLDFLAVSLYNDFINGVIAQLVARLNGIQKVRGSNPLSSTKPRKRAQDAPFLHVSGFGHFRFGKLPRRRRGMSTGHTFPLLRERSFRWRFFAREKYNRLPIDNFARR